MRNLPANAGDAGSIPGLEDPLEEEMATQSAVLAWEIPRSPDGPWNQKRVGHNLVTKQQQTF